MNENLIVEIKPNGPVWPLANKSCEKLLVKNNQGYNPEEDRAKEHDAYDCQNPSC